jgi:four helix bundle protein
MQQSEIIGQNRKLEFKKAFTKRLIFLSLSIIHLGEELQKHRILWRVIDQLVSSGTSIGANVVEAKASGSRREFRKYFEIALKSGNETIYCC